MVSSEAWSDVESPLDSETLLKFVQPPFVPITAASPSNAPTTPSQPTPTNSFNPATSSQQSDERRTSISDAFLPVVNILPSSSEPDTGQPLPKRRGRPPKHMKAMEAAEMLRMKKAMETDTENDNLRRSSRVVIQKEREADEQRTLALIQSESASQTVTTSSQPQQPLPSSLAGKMGKRRGRPPKNLTAVTVQPPPKAPTTAPAVRGRPPKGPRLNVPAAVLSYINSAPATVPTAESISFRWFKGFREGELVWSKWSPEDGREERLWPCLVIKRWECDAEEDGLEVLRRNSAVLVESRGVKRKRDSVDVAGGNGERKKSRDEVEGKSVVEARRLHEQIFGTGEQHEEDEDEEEEVLAEGVVYPHPSLATPVRSNTPEALVPNGTHVVGTSDERGVVQNDPSKGAKATQETGSQSAGNPPLGKAQPPTPRKLADILALENSVPVEEVTGTDTEDAGSRLTLKERRRSSLQWRVKDREGHQDTEGDRDADAGAGGARGIEDINGASDGAEAMNIDSESSTPNPSPPTDTVQSEPTTIIIEDISDSNEDDNQPSDNDEASPIVPFATLPSEPGLETDRELLDSDSSTSTRSSSPTSTSRHLALSSALLSAYTPFPNPPTKSLHYILRPLPVRSGPIAAIHTPNPVPLGKRGGKEREKERNRTPYVWKEARDVLPYLVHEPDVGNWTDEMRAGIQSVAIRSGWSVACEGSVAKKERGWVEAGSLEGALGVLGFEGGDGEGSELDVGGEEEEERERERQEETAESISPLVVHTGEAPPGPVRSRVGSTKRVARVERVRVGAERVHVGDLVRIARGGKPRGRPPRLGKGGGVGMGEFLEVERIEVWFFVEEEEGLGLVGGSGGQWKGYEVGRRRNTVKFFGSVWRRVREGDGTTNGVLDGLKKVKIEPDIDIESSLPSTTNSSPTHRHHHHHHHDEENTPLLFRKVSEGGKVDVRDIAGRFHVNFPMLKGRMGVFEEQGWGGELEEEVGRRRAEEIRRGKGRVVVPLRRE
ncbi:hypothetical protein HDV00_000583 [Rhizophlyctis rosea]|nr:hypothetical protein HDV00_000583 [Rhizophlyctis rosea]